jgi:acyl-CoA synthetase (AMP-forming)/AMP-acid ligase II
MDEYGRSPQGPREVVIRGRNVTKGYESNPEANAKAFTHGWFRTGDQGVIDEQGYLRLTGRLKELINRGGEKISPLEIDTIIMDHPSVAQVVTFGMPHDKLGEDIAAPPWCCAKVPTVTSANCAPLSVRGSPISRCRAASFLEEILQAPRASCSASGCMKSWPTSSMLG